MSEKFFNIVVEKLLKDTTIDFVLGNYIVLPPMTQALNIRPNILPYESGCDRYENKERYDKGTGYIRSMFCKYMESKYGVSRTDGKVVWEIYKERLLEQIT